MVDVSIWATSPLWVAVRYIFCVFFFFSSPPGYVALQDSKTPHRPAGERVSWCLKTFPPSRLQPQERSLSLTLLSLFLSFIFCPTSFWKEWAAFLVAWCPPPAFRSCFAEVAQHSNDLLMNLWRKIVVSLSYSSAIFPKIWKDVLKEKICHLLVFYFLCNVMCEDRDLPDCYGMT